MESAKYFWETGPIDVNNVQVVNNPNTNGIGGLWNVPQPNLCPGCGRCNVCGRETPQTAPYNPYAYPPPYTPPTYPQITYGQTSHLWQGGQVQAFNTTTKAVQDFQESSDPFLNGR